MAQKETKSQEQPPVTTAIAVNKDVVGSLFDRGANALLTVKSISMGRALTRPLLAMAHLKALLVEIKGEMRIQQLPSQSRKGEMDDVRVIDIVALAGDEGKVQAGEEYTLTMNEVMVSALERGGYTVLLPKKDGDKIVGYEPKLGNSLIGKAFGFKSGNINNGKKYRTVDTVEVNIER